MTRKISFIAGLMLGWVFTAWFFGGWFAISIEAWSGQEGPDWATVHTSSAIAGILLASILYWSFVWLICKKK